MLKETVLATSLLSGMDSFPIEGLGSSLDAFGVFFSTLFGGVVSFFYDDFERFEDTTEVLFSFLVGSDYCYGASLTIAARGFSGIEFYLLTSDPV